MQPCPTAPLRRRLLKAAAQALRRACELAPEAASAWFNLGEALKADPRDAAAAFAHAVQLGARHVRAWGSRAG